MGCKAREDINTTLVYLLLLLAFKEREMRGWYVNGHEGYERLKVAASHNANVIVH